MPLMSTTDPIWQTDDLVRFDELLLQPWDVDDPGYKRREKWQKAAGIGLVLFGFGMLTFFLVEFVRMHFWGVHRSLMEYAQFYGELGETISGSVGLMGLGGLIYSFVFLAQQVKEARDAHLRQDMPIVFVAPRLLWAIARASNGSIVARKLALYVGIRNIGDTPATQVAISVRKLVYSAKNGSQREVPLPGFARQLIDYLPARQETIGDRYLESMEWPITEQCPELIDSMFSYRLQDAESPALRMEISASFKTIRGVKFCSCGSAVWSPKHCRNVKDHKQPDFLHEFEQARMEFDRQKGGLDKYLQGADDNPLVPVIETIDRDKCEECKS
jgi:hypothetical protein